MPTFYSRLALGTSIFLAGIVSAVAQTPTFERHFGARGTFDELKSGQPTADGGYVALGTTVNRSHGYTDLWLVKTNAAGDTVFTRTYGGPAAETGTAVQQTPDGGYLLAGSTRSFGAGREDFYLVKTTATGAMQWQRTFGSADAEICNSMALTADGGAVLAGRREFSGSASFSTQIFVVKADAAGNPAWSQAYSRAGVNGEQAHAVQQTTDGGYIVAGAIGYERDDLLLKLNAQGATQWRRSYASAAGDYGNALTVHQTTDGGYVLGGKYSISTGGTYIEAARVTKTDASGLVTRTYDVPALPGSGFSSVQDVRQTADGGYAILLGNLESYAELHKVNASWQLTFSRVIPTVSDNQPVRTVRQTPDEGYVLAGSSTRLSSGGDGMLVRYSANGTLQWQRDYGVPGSTGYEFGRDIASTPDGGGVVLSEEQISSTNSFLTLRLTKLAANGATQWSNSIANPGSGGSTAASIRRTPDGGYIVLAHTSNSTLQLIQLIKTDSQGAVQWRKSYGGINVPAVFGKAIPTTDGGYAVISSSPSAGPSSRSRAWLLKLNSVGDTLWTRKFGNASVNSNGYDLVQTTDGGYAFAGRTSPGTRGQQAWIVRTNAAGQPTWNRTYGRASADRVTSLQQTTDGGVILAGYSNDPVTLNPQSLLLKLSAAGDSTWARLLSPPSAFTFGYRALQTADGGYVLTHLLTPDPYDITGRIGQFTKTDATGTTIWQRTFGAGGVPLLYSLEASADGGFLSVGSIVNEHGDGDVYVIKTDGNGQVLTTSSAAKARPELLLYPNPARAQVRLQLPADVRTGPLRLTLHDQLGRTVRQWAVLAPAPADMPLDVRGLARGTYLLRVSGGPAAGQKLSRRLVLE